MRNLFISLCVAVSLLAAGCSSTPIKTAFTATSVTITVVNMAEDYWGNYVRAGKATDDQQNKVRAAVNSYNAAMKVYQDAVDAYYDSGSSNMAPVDAAATAFNNSKTDLFNLVVSFLPLDQQAQLKAAALQPTQ